MSKLLLPALRGSIGDWVFYSCIMPITEIGRRVSYADEVHQNKQLSEMIQRELKKGRASEIAEYLATQEQRFFNSLVLAVYDSDPEWYPVSHVEGRYRDIDLEQVEDRIESLGLLELSPSLEMFAVDGQHRLSGIKLLLEQGGAGKDDQLPVVLVGHKKTKAGLERTRRLFTTLNKTAKVVSKGETIALDEDDAAAIVVRRLVEQHPYFAEQRIAYRPGNNLPAGNQVSLTTLGNLYDVTWTILGKVCGRSGKALDKRVRPSDDVLAEYHENVVAFFEGLGERFPPVSEFLRTKNYTAVVSSNRHPKGGHVLFRPVGLSIFTDILAELAVKRKMDVDSAMDAVAQLPVKLGARPYAGLLWDSGRGAMNTKGKTITRDLLRAAIGLGVDRDALRKKLASWLGEAPKDVDLAAWLPAAGPGSARRKGAGPGTKGSRGE